MESQAHDVAFWKFINIAALLIMACSSHLWMKSEKGNTNAQFNDFMYEMANKLNAQSRKLNNAVAMRVEGSLKQAHQEIRRSHGVLHHMTALRATCDGAFLTVLEREPNTVMPIIRRTPSALDETRDSDMGSPVRPRSSLPDLPIISGTPSELGEAGSYDVPSTVSPRPSFLDFSGNGEHARVVDVTADVANAIRGLPAGDLDMVRKKIQVYVLWNEVDEYLPCYMSTPERIDEVRTKSGLGCFTLWKKPTVASVMDNDHELLRAVMATRQFHMIPTGMRDRAKELLDSIQVMDD